MGKIFKTTFDFFSYAIPGSAIIIALMFCNSDIATPLEIISEYSEMIVEEGFQFTIALLVTGYLIGFLVYPIGRSIYRFVGSKMAWLVLSCPDKEYDPGPTVAKRFTLVRELAPVNFAYIEKWHMHAALSHGLALAGLVGVAVGIFRISHSTSSATSWWWFLAICLFISYMGIERAITFSEWAKNDLNETIKKYKLEARASAGIPIQHLLDTPDSPS